MEPIVVAPKGPWFTTCQVALAESFLYYPKLSRISWGGCGCTRSIQIVWSQLEDGALFTLTSENCHHIVFDEINVRAHLHWLFPAQTGLFSSLSIPYFCKRSKNMWIRCCWCVWMCGWMDFFVIRVFWSNKLWECHFLQLLKVFGSEFSAFKIVENGGKMLEIFFSLCITSSRQRMLQEPSRNACSETHRYFSRERKLTRVKN